MVYRASLWAALLAFGLGACSSGPSGRDYADGPPSTPHDICTIFEERPHWRDATQAAALRWGVPVELQMAIIWRESSFRPKARPPRTTALGLVTTGYASSAYGYAQAIDGTWRWYRDETGQRDADRTDFADAADFVGWYVNKTIQSNGVSVYDAFAQYLNYHEGHAGYRRGMWRNKAWLKRAATEVAEQTVRYRGQLPTCRSY